jgi:hypothetical protein
MKRQFAPEEVFYRAPLLLIVKHQLLDRHIIHFVMYVVIYHCTNNTFAFDELDKHFKRSVRKASVYLAMLIHPSVLDSLVMKISWLIYNWCIVLGTPERDASWLFIGAILYRLYKTWFG